MRKIALIILLALVLATLAQAQAPAWPDFYMSKVGSYYNLNVYKTPIRCWVLPDTTSLSMDTLSGRIIFGHLYGTADSLGGNPWTSYLRSDVPDTFARLTGTALVTDTVIANKQVRAGADTTKANVTLDTLDGILLKHGATVWDDIRVPGVSFKNGATAPNFGLGTRLGGIYVYSFAGTGVGEDINTSVQLLHMYKPGTPLDAHVHGACFGAVSGAVDTVTVGIEYAWLSIGDTLLNPNFTDTITGTYVLSTDSLRRHIMLPIGTVPVAFSASTKKESSMLMIRMFRNPADPLDTYAQPFEIYEFDLRYEKEKLGTKNVLPD